MEKVLSTLSIRILGEGGSLKVANSIRAWFWGIGKKGKDRLIPRGGGTLKVSILVNVENSQGNFDEANACGGS